MIRILLAALCLVALAAPVRAGGADDLKAATAAAQQGKFADAVNLFTQALSAGDLSPADQVIAHKGRAEEYISQSLIADAFGRLDQARQAREDAIADYGAALKIKANDADLLAARAQAYNLSGQFDRAVADFDAAYKRNNSVVTLVQRAGSEGAKGDYDRAVADYTAALARVPQDGKDSGDVDAVGIYSQRGYTQFLAARFDAAADDFAKALSLGSAERKGDVLWIPYHMAWLHVARARAGQNDAEELARNAGKIDIKQWPGTLIAYFLGKAELNQLAAPSDHGGMGNVHECNLSFFAAEQALAKKDAAEANRLLVRARAACNVHTIYYAVAGVELKRLGK
jgi:tetratricopeptide (TPR) repeat protein